MNSNLTFIAGLLVSISTSLGVIFYLRKHLASILTEVCGTQTRANYWQKITTIWLLLAPLSLSMLRKPKIANTLLFELSSYLGLTIFGILSTLFISSLAIFIFMPSAKEI